MAPTVFLTRTLPDPIMRELRRRFRLRFNREDRPLSKAEILRGVRKADGLISMLSDAIDREIIEAAPDLRVIANYAVGYNNIDLNAARERGMVVTNTPGVLTETTADLTWALILSVARRIPEAEQFARSGKWTGWAPTQLLGGDVFGKTLGIVGLGRIGQAVARRAAGFEMRVVYTSRRRLPIREEKRFRASFLPLSDLLRESDFVSLHLPLTPESRHLIDRKALRRMKPTAFLINTARGPIIDEEALIEALRNKQIAGAGLDVFENEPAIPRELREIKEAVLLPHVGSASLETRIRMGRIVLENIVAVLTGKKPPNMVK
ncbi:MAG: D-glycerate dehydrogenase [Candidatus Manganitrophaceae bacterium]|nr:MAG: D-glycerate dehydrogenase [Candidatus Manganitrophaceae bacterium]